MVRDLTLTDETYEQLADQRRDDESAADVVRRLLGSTAGQNSSSAAEGDDVNETAGVGIAPTETDELARSSMTVGEVQAAMVEQLSAGAYIRREYGVDPEDYDSEAALVEAVHEQRDSTEQPAPVTAGAAASGGDDRSTGTGAMEGEVEQLAGKVLNLDDIQRMEARDLSAREYLAERKGVDPADYNTEEGLRRGLARAQAESGDEAAGGAR